MALIICPECQQQISDQATVCPKCGYPLAETPFPDAQLTNEPSPAVAKTTKKSKKPVIIGCVVIVCIALIAAIAFFAKKNADEKAMLEARADYIDNLNDFLYESLDGAAEAETLCNLTYKVWYDTIYEEYRTETAEYTRTNGTYNEDFNTSLRKLYASDTAVDAIKEIESNQDDVDKLYKALQNPTDEFESCFDVVEDMYSAYYKLTNLAVSPSGNLSSYSDDFSEYDSEYIEHYDKLKLLIPDA